jgi:hypothetical protein
MLPPAPLHQQLCSPPQVNTLAHRMLRKARRAAHALTRLWNAPLTGVPAIGRPLDLSRLNDHALRDLNLREHPHSQAQRASDHYEQLKARSRV